VEVAAGGRPASTARYCELTKGQKKEKMARGCFLQCCKVRQRAKTNGETTEQWNPKLEVELGFEDGASSIWRVGMEKELVMGAASFIAWLVEEIRVQKEGIEGHLLDFWRGEKKESSLHFGR
jgi:hypothetical protein